MLTLDRRTLLSAGSAAVAVGASALTGSNPALARGPQAGKQAPGFYRFKLGTMEVTVVSDGMIAFPVEMTWPERPDEIRTLLASEFYPTSSVGFQLNVILVNTGDKLLLIDAGTGGKFQPTGGALLGNLAAAGIAASDVDMVLLTHAHPDHLWGATDAGNAALLFPSAEIVASEAEVGFWTASELPGKVPPGMRQLVETTQQNLKVIAPRTRLIKPGSEVISGIRTIDTAGHTPGHMSVHIGSGGEGLVVTGDAVTNVIVSFRRPEVLVGFDMDQAQGAKTRVAFLDRLASDKTLVASYHLPFPAVGHVARDGSAYRWAPAEWRWAM